MMFTKCTVRSSIRKIKLQKANNVPNSVFTKPTAISDNKGKSPFYPDRYKKGLFAILCGLLKYSCEKLLFHENNLLNPPLEKEDSPLSPPFFKGGRGDYCIIKGLIPCL